MAEGEETKESVVLAWKAPEYQEYTRNWKYYAIVGVLFLAVLGYCIYTNDWFTLGVFVILAVFFLWYQRLKPVEKTYRFTQLGLYIDSRFYPYHDIHSYWLILGENNRTLNMYFAKKYVPQLTIMIPKEIDPLKIRNTLSKYVPEDVSRTENMMDILMRWFRL
jgi:hypothetical protein